MNDTHPLVEPFDIDLEDLSNDELSSIPTEWWKDTVSCSRIGLLRWNSLFSLRKIVSTDRKSLRDFLGAAQYILALSQDRRCVT